MAPPASTPGRKGAEEAALAAVSRRRRPQYERSATGEQAHESNYRVWQVRLRAISGGVISGENIDAEASDYFERLRVEVKLEVVPRSFAIVHVGHKEAPLAHFGKTFKAFHGPDRLLATPLQSPYSPPQDTSEPCRRNRFEPDLKMRSRI